MVLVPEIITSYLTPNPRYSRKVRSFENMLISTSSRSVATILFLTLPERRRNEPPEPPDILRDHDMDFSLRCNSLKCRSHFDGQAVVTTCSHIFCIPCSQSLGLANTNADTRICPACETQLSKPDDVVVTHLNPTEDYKTSVLSGLSPAVIMECAGRGLSFYSYQTSQEMSVRPIIRRGDC